LIQERNYFLQNVRNFMRTLHRVFSKRTFRYKMKFTKSTSLQLRRRITYTENFSLFPRHSSGSDGRSGHWATAPTSSCITTKYKRNFIVKTKNCK